MTELVYDTIR